MPLFGVLVMLGLLLVGDALNAIPQQGQSSLHERNKLHTLYNISYHLHNGSYQR
jgi:hypothetical protein